MDVSNISQIQLLIHSEYLVPIELTLNLVKDLHVR